MERLQVSIVSHYAQDSVQIGFVNFCGEDRDPPDIPNSHPDNQETSNAKQTKTKPYIKI